MSAFSYIKDPLLRAVLEDDAKTVAKLAQSGGNVNASDGTVGTTLNAAILDHNLAMLKLLLELGSDPNQTVKNHDAPLCAAALQRDIKAVELLLAKGAKVNLVHNDQTPLLSAIFAEDLNIAKRLIEAGADLFFKNKHGVDPLSAIEQSKSRKLVQYIKETAKQSSGSGSLEQVAKVGEIRKMKELLPGASAASKKAAIVAAVEEGHADALSLLIQGGVDANTKRTEKGGNQWGGALLHIAAANGAQEVVAVLIEAGADLNIRDEYRVTPLMCAASHGKLPVVKQLVQAGADLHAKNKEGSTALTLAQESGYKRIIGFLEPMYQEQAPSGLTLHQAAQDGLVAHVKRLLEQGAKVNDRDKSGSTPILIAAEHGHPEVVELLMRHGADLTALNKDEKDLWSVALWSSLGAKTPQIKRLVELFLKAGMNPNQRPRGKCSSADGWGIWELAISSEAAAEVVPLLLKAGLNPNQPLPEGYTPLLYAASHGDKGVVEVLRVLLEAGADGQTVLVKPGKPMPKITPEFLKEQPPEIRKRLIALKEKSEKETRLTALDLAKEHSKKAYEFLRDYSGAKLDAYDLGSKALKLLQDAAQTPEAQDKAKEVGKRLGCSPKPWKRKAGVWHYTTRLDKVFSVKGHAEKSWDMESRHLAPMQAELRIKGFTLVHHAQSHDARNLTSLLLFPTTNWAAVLIANGTNGANHGLTTRKIVEWFAQTEKTQPFVILGCGHDFIEVQFVPPVKDTQVLQSKIIEFCPEIESDEEATPEEWKDHFKKDGRVFFWWD